MLATFLVAAQWGALVHAFEHDVGTPQNPVCMTCVAASQLGLACIDTSMNIEPLPSYAVPNFDAAESVQSIHAPAARQRGPPSPR